MRSQPTIAAANRRRSPKRTKSAAGQPAKGEKYHLRAIGRALDVLECFTDERRDLNLKEIRGLVALPESSLFRVLLTLESRGYLIQNPDGSYRLSPTLLLGKLHERAEKLRERMRPFLQSLASRFDETASLAYLFGYQIQAIDTVETFHEIRMTNRAGRVLPPHCSSLGKAITAFQEPGHIDLILECYGLYKRTDHTVIDRQALLEELERIRRQGYAVDREETVAGGICIGVPIARADVPVVASISVSTPLIRMTPEREREITETLLDTACHAAQALHAS
jgi:DNA-binding IclR family transcriptional regulator